MKINIILLFSRPYALNRVISSLEALQHPKDTNLLVISDTTAKDFPDVRNAIMSLDYKERLVLHYDKPTQFNRPLKEYEVIFRRKRIAELHNFAKAHLWNGNYVLVIEDDSIYEPDSLVKLLKIARKHPDFGAITGFQPSRNNQPFLGIWRTDNIERPTKIWSLLPNESHEIDGCGLYFLLTKQRLYGNHTFKPYGTVLGPDYNYGNYLRRQGLKIYVDWNCPILHATKDGTIPMDNFARLTLVKGQSVWSYVWS